MRIQAIATAVRSVIGRADAVARRRLGAGCYAAAIMLLAAASYLFSPLRTERLDELADPYSYALYTAMFGGFAGGFLLIEVGRRLRPAQAEELVGESREFVLYLRPFSADSLSDPRRTGVFMLVPPEGYEEALVRSLRRVAPVVAIQRPGEALPPLGAARLALSEEWRPVVEDLMRRAKLILLVGGASDGVRWEIETALRLPDPKRLLVFLGLRDYWRTPADYSAFLACLPGRRVTYRLHAEDSLFLIFDAAWEPQFIKPWSWNDWLSMTDLLVNSLERALAQMSWLRTSLATRWGHLGAHALGVLYILLLISIGVVYQMIEFHKARQHPWGRHVPYSAGVKGLRDAEKSWRIRKKACEAEMLSLERGEFYTQGSSRKAVVLIQGKPRRETDNTLSYDLGDVTLVSDHVIDWHYANIFSFSSEVLAKLDAKLLQARRLSCDLAMLPGHEESDATDLISASFITGEIEKQLLTGFTTGSSRFHVRMAQGVPDSESKSRACGVFPRCEISFVYGGEEVFFEGDHVIGWTDRGRRLKLASPH